MRAVLLIAHTADGEVQHRYVARRLIQEFRGELGAIVVATGIQRSFKEKIKRVTRRYTTSQAASRVVARLYRFVTRADTRRQATYRSVLFPDGENGKMPGGDRIRLVKNHNGNETISVLEQLNPDIVIVYGTLIIGTKVIEACRRIINLHTGFSPTYRGSDTIFWALHNGDSENVGATVHRLEAGVDSGPILARGKPSIEPGDDEDRLFAKAVMLGTELLCRAIRREVQGTANPLTQRLELGREYRSVDRTLAAELRTRKLLKSGLLAEGRCAWSEEF